MVPCHGMIIVCRLSKRPYLDSTPLSSLHTLFHVRSSAHLVSCFIPVLDYGSVIFAKCSSNSLLLERTRTKAAKVILACLRASATSLSFPISASLHCLIRENLCECYYIKSNLVLLPLSHCVMPLTFSFFSPNVRWCIIHFCLKLPYSGTPYHNTSNYHVAFQRLKPAPPVFTIARN